MLHREVSFNVPGGAKVGVVGRTGAGKSSLITALFRIVEPLSGDMCIDGESILRVPLHTLRTKIAIVPQVSLPIMIPLLVQLLTFNFFLTVGANTFPRIIAL